MGDHSVAHEPNQTICWRPPKSLITAATVSSLKMPLESGAYLATSQVVDGSVMMAG